MKVAWSGQFTRGKALQILEEAAVECPNVHLNILGDGKLNKKYHKLAKNLGVDQFITWHGWVEKSKAEAVVAESDIFVITSLRDLTSTVLLEALSKGKPVVCLDHCGFSDVVDETCGIKIPVGKPRDVVKGFAEAICRLKDPKLRARLSKGALEKARQYLWSEKAKTMKRIYGVSGKKVLATVYCCSPYRGSEPGEGWNYLKIIAEENEVWAIVEEEKWRGDIERWMADLSSKVQNSSVPSPRQTGEYEWVKNVHWVFLRKPRARWLRKIWPPSYYWFYRIWHWRAYKLAQKLDRDVHFDIFHQLNMVSFREPGYLWKFNRRFVWGPIGGLGYTDWRLLPLLGFAGAMEFFMRNVINWCHAHFLIRPRLAARRASETNSMIVATEENRREAEKLWGVESQLLCEIGVDSVDNCIKMGGGRLIMAWSGLFEERKALPILLLALKHLAMRRRRDEGFRHCACQQSVNSMR